MVMGADSPQEWGCFGIPGTPALGGPCTPALGSWQAAGRRCWAFMVFLLCKASRQDPLQIRLFVFLKYLLFPEFGHNIVPEATKLMRGRAHTSNLGPPKSRSFLKGMYNLLPIFINVSLCSIKSQQELAIQ